MTKKSAAKDAARTRQKEHGGNYEAHLRTIAGGGAERRLRWLVVYVEWETSYRAGAGGCFQIVEVQEDGREIDRPVNNGIHFHDLAELEDYLSKEVFFGDDIEVTLENS